MLKYFAAECMSMFVHACVLVCVHVCVHVNVCDWKCLPSFQWLVSNTYNMHSHLFFILCASAEKDACGACWHRGAFRQGRPILCRGHRTVSPVTFFTQFTFISLLQGVKGQKEYTPMQWCLSLWRVWFSFAVTVWFIEMVIFFLPLAFLKPFIFLITISVFFIVWM